MLKMYMFLTLLIIHCAAQYANSGNSYYFRMGKTANEFRVNNRVYYLNHNITDYDYTHKRVSHIQKTNNKNFSNNNNETIFIDEEWNFDHENITKTEIPLFINKFYDQFTVDVKSTSRILFNVNRNTSNNAIKFNLESLKANETVLDADFYFFWPLQSNSEIYRESVVLRLYQIEKHEGELSDDSPNTDNPDVHKLFNVIYISKAQRGWQIFKIKKPIDNWFNGEDNLGLILTISSYDDNKLISVFNDFNEGIYRSFAVVTVQNNETEPADHEVKYTETATSCKKKQWTISFKKLNWDNFIIAPEGFVANDCAGKCLNLQDDEVNHVKLLRTFTKRAPCCVPTNYLPLPVMFYDKFGNIVIKNYENMIVSKCGCR